MAPSVVWVISSKETWRFPTSMRKTSVWNPTSSSSPALSWRTRGKAEQQVSGPQLESVDAANVSLR